MKKSIHPSALPMLTLILGIAGMGLRFWLFASLTEDQLLPAWHPAAIGAGLLTAAVLVCLFLYTKPLKGQRKYRINFPPSIPAALCCFAAGAAMFLRGMGLLLDAQTSISTVAGIASIVGAPCLLLIGMSRWKGQRTIFLIHGVLSLCFAAQLMLHYQTWTSSPNFQLHIYRMLATIGLMLTAYHRAEFDVRMASRRGYSFVNLSALFFCLLAVPEGEAFYFLAMAACLLTNQCALTTLRLRRAPQSQPAPAAPEESSPAEPALEDILSGWPQEEI